MARRVVGSTLDLRDFRLAVIFQYYQAEPFDVFNWQNGKFSPKNFTLKFNPNFRNDKSETLEKAPYRL
jgi:hypothetical protein